MKTIDVDVNKKKKENKIAVSLNTFDKYKPGKHLFYIQALTPTKDKNKKFKDSQADLSNVKNKDKGALNAKLPKVGSAIELEIPKEVSRWFETKFIPPGTRFVVAFDGGDATRPKIVGRDYIDEQGGYNNEEEGGEEGGGEQ